MFTRKLCDKICMKKNIKSQVVYYWARDMGYIPELRLSFAQNKEWENIFVAFEIGSITGEAHSDILSNLSFSYSCSEIFYGFTQS